MSRKHKSPSQKRHVGKCADRRKKRFRLAEAQNWRCCYCGDRVDESQTTTEHIVPAALGGTNDWENLAMACFPCNQKNGIELNRRLQAAMMPPCGIPASPVST
jgi:uncharacterized protein (TIGR02646 family)